MSMLKIDLEQVPRWLSVSFVSRVTIPVDVSASIIFAVIFNEHIKALG